MFFVSVYTYPTVCIILISLAGHSILFFCMTPGQDLSSYPWTHPSSLAIFNLVL